MHRGTSQNVVFYQKMKPRNGICITSFAGIGDFFPKENSSNEVSPEKSGLSVANEHPGTSSEEQGIEGIEEIVED